MNKELRFFLYVSRRLKQCTLFLMLLISAAAYQARGQANPTVMYNFEDGTTEKWQTASATYATFSLNSTSAMVRTGTYSLHIVNGQTTTTTYYSPSGGIVYNGAASTTGQYLADATTTSSYVWYICWLYQTTSGTSTAATTAYWCPAFFTSTASVYATTSIGTLRSSSTAAQSYSTTGTWQLFFSLSNTSTKSMAINPALIKAGKVTNDVWMDDGILYATIQTQPDVFAPTAAPIANSITPSANTVTINVTATTDNTSTTPVTVNGVSLTPSTGATGIQGTLILRAASGTTGSPTLNNQGYYSAGTNPGGAHTDKSGNWTVVDNTSSTSGDISFTDINGAYIYAAVQYDQAYNYSPAAITSSVTLPAATVTVTTTGAGTSWTGTFGSQVINSPSAVQNFTVSGANIGASGGITVTAPTGTGYLVSLNSTGTYGASVNITGTGTIAATPVYVKFDPTTADGAESGNIISSATNAPNISTAVTGGNALATEPTAAGTLSFSSVTGSSMVVTYTAPGSGGGSNHIIVAYPTTAPTYMPGDGAAVTGVNSLYTSATDHGTGHIVYDGTGNTVTVTGLTGSTTYNFAVYEYNVGTGTSQNYFINPGTASQATASPSIVLSPTSLTNFGNQVTGTTSATEQSFTVTGTNLTTDVTVTPPTGFQISSTSGAEGTGAVTLTQTSGSASGTIYVKYAPVAAVGDVTANIVCTSNTATQNEAVSGTSIAAEPTTAGTLSFGTITTTSIVVNVSGGNGSNRIIVAYPSAPGFVPSDGVTITGEGSTPATYGSGTNQSSNGYVVYDGTGSTVTVTGLTSNQAYYFVDYEYNLGTNNSQNYLTTSPATNNATTFASGTPLIIASGTLTAFGNVAAGASSAEQSFVVSGSSLTADLFVAPPAGFIISMVSGSESSSTIDLPQSGGSVGNTTIYVEYAPASATGAASGNIACTTTGATEVDESVSGNAISVAPTAVGSLSAGTVTNSSVTLNYTAPGSGGGAYLVIVANAGASTSYTPVSGAAAATGNTAYTTANQVVYNGVTGSTGIATITGLTQGTQYTFTVYEYNSGTGTTGTAQNYYTPGSSVTQATTAPLITVTSTGFGTFGNQVTGTTSAEQSFTVSGSNLTNDVTVTPPTGFQISTTSGAESTSSITLTQSGGTVATTTIYAVFSPTGATGSASGNIVSASIDATSKNAPETANAIATEPTTPPTVTFGTVNATSIVVNFSGGNGTNHLLVVNTVTPTYILPADGVAAAAGVAAYTTANQVVYNGTGSTVTVTGLTASTTYYFTEYEYNVGTGTSQNYLATPTTVNTTTGITTNYYFLASASDPTATGSWTTTADGTVSTAPPSNFTTAQQIFHVSNGLTSFNLSSVWTISGTGSKLAVDDGIDFTLTGSSTGDYYAGTIDIGINRNVVFSVKSTNLLLGTLDPTSTITFGAATTSTIPSGTYGNLILTGSSSQTLLGNTTIVGNLTLSRGSSSGLSLSTFTLNVAGNIYNSGSNLGDDILNVSGGTINFNGTSSQTVDANTFTGSNGKSILNMTIANGSAVTLLGTTSIPNITGALVLNGSLAIGANVLTLTTTTAPTGTGTVDASAGTLALASTITIPSTFLASSNIKNLTLTSGTTTWNPTKTNVTGILTLTAGTLNIVSDTLNIAGTVPAHGGVINATAGVVEFTGTANQTVATPGIFSGTVNNLIINNTNTSGTVTLGNATVVNNLTLTKGALTVTGGLTISNGGTVTVAGGTLSANPTYTTSVNVVAAGGTLTSGKELTPATLTTLGTLTVNSGTYTLATALNPSLTGLTVSSGATIDVGTNVVTLTGTTPPVSIYGTFKNSNINGFTGASNTAINNTNTPVVTLNPGSTVVYYGTGTPPVTPMTYSNLTVSSASVLSGSTTVGGTLTIASGQLLSLNGNTLTINDFGGAGALTGSATSGVVITGALSNPLMFDETSIATSTLGSLTLSNSATLGDSLHMASGSTEGVVSISGGTFTTGSFLTLMSDVNGTARIDAISGGGTVSGAVNIQRYIPGQRGYRLLGHPYTTDQDIATLGSYFDITGITAGNLGACTGTSPSVFSYSAGTSPGYVGITATGAGTFPAATSGSTHANGILAFIRGADGEGCSGGTYTPSAVTFRTSSAINQGDFTETVLNNGWNLITNPYPSQVALANVDGISSLNGVIVVQPGQQSLGVTSTNGTAYLDITSSASSYILPINGAFLANNTSGSTVSLVFHEASKTSGTAATGTFKTTGVYPILQLSVYNGSALWDNWHMALKPGTTAAAGEDGDLSKISNTLFDIYSLSADNKELAVDARDENTITDGSIISLGLRSVPQGSYTVNVSEYSIPSNKTVYLHDKYTNIYTLVDNGVNYPFTVSSDASSQGQNRLELVFNVNNNNTGVSNINSRTSGIIIIPNPATSNVNISYGNELAGAKDISIVNVVGQVVRVANTAEQAITIPVSDLANGVYMIKTIVNGKAITERFIKN